MSLPDLGRYGLLASQIHHNPDPKTLYDHALAQEPSSAIAASGALIAFSGEKTGRSPNDKRLVNDPEFSADIWWGPVNKPIGPEGFKQARNIAIEHLSQANGLYVIDGYAGAEESCRVAIRVICERPYHALFMRNMLIMPEDVGLPVFETPDYTILNAGRAAVGTQVILSLAAKELVILGTEYAGEMKKGVFTLMNYLMPKQGILSMHCSANQGEAGDVSLFFGLSGTGKTTLSADPSRHLIGDDEHCWSDAGVANIEGGCYAKVIDLSAEAEPQIHAAIRFGAVLENVVHNPETGEVDYTDGSITENTRCAYPVSHVERALIPGVGPAPSQIMFLTCDAFSVLPPVSRLTPQQAMYHFMSGYTAKVAGTEVGISEPQATFSACFGAPFLVWHPAVYARMLEARLEKHGTDVWLINTGWTGGPYGVGKRMRLAYTRAMIDAIHSNAFAQVEFRQDPVFGLAVPTQCPGVPAEVLDPSQAWSDPAEYWRAAADLAELFRRNFAQYADETEARVLAAGPASAERIHQLVASAETV